MKKIIYLAMVFSALTNNVLAGNSTNTLKTTASLTTMCKLSTTDINFGELDFIKNKSVITSTGTLNVFCNKGTPYKITPEGGWNNGYERLLKSTDGGNYGIYYHIYKPLSDVDPTLRGWTRLSTNSGMIVGIGNAQNQETKITAYTAASYMPNSLESALNNTYNYQAKAGTYSETITAKIDF